MSIPDHESWLPVVGYEGMYEVSDMGRVRSVSRTVKSKGPGVKWVQGRILKQQRGTTGRLCITLHREKTWWKRCVHRLVAEAFLADSHFEGSEVCHRNGIADDNSASNLYWGTKSQNAQDTVRHGNNPMRRRTHCPQRHPYDEDNTIWEKKGAGKVGRRCRTCKRIKDRRAQSTRPKAEV